MSMALQTAIQVAGSQTALAAKLRSYTSNHKIRQGHIWCWLNRDKKVPAEYCLAIEQITNGQVTASDLRPDIFGQYTSHKTVPAPSVRKQVREA